MPLPKRENGRVPPIQTMTEPSAWVFSYEKRCSLLVFFCPGNECLPWREGEHTKKDMPFWIRLFCLFTCYFALSGYDHCRVFRSPAEKRGEIPSLFFSFSHPKLFLWFFSAWQCLLNLMRRSRPWKNAKRRKEKPLKQYPYETTLSTDVVASIESETNIVHT